jgi:hypothetical protein
MRKKTTLKEAAPHEHTGQRQNIYTPVRWTCLERISLAQTGFSRFLSNCNDVVGKNEKEYHDKKLNSPIYL